MSKFVLLNEYLKINSVELSDHVTNVMITADAESLDASAMSSDAWKEFLAGLKGAQLQFEVLDDFAASSVDATLWSAFATSVAFEVKAVNTTTSATNPKFSGNVLCTQYTVGGAINTVAKKSLTFPVTGTLSRTTS